MLQKLDDLLPDDLSVHSGSDQPLAPYARKFTIVDLKHADPIAREFKAPAIVVDQALVPTRHATHGRSV
jgi:hypothetical protein